MFCYRCMVPVQFGIFYLFLDTALPPPPPPPGNSKVSFCDFYWKEAVADFVYRGYLGGSREHVRPLDLLLNSIIIFVGQKSGEDPGFSLGKIRSSYRYQKRKKEIRRMKKLDVNGPFGKFTPTGFTVLVAKIN